MCNNPYEERRKVYFKKEEYYYQLPEDFCIGHTGKLYEECAATGLPQHSLCVISVGIKLSVEKNYNEIKLVPMICSSKIPSLLRKISKQDLEKSTDEYEIYFYIKVKPNLSAILNYISYNFDILYEDPKIALLDEEDLFTLLRHKDISTGHEDQILKAACLWRSSKPIDNNYHRVFSCINWQYCSLEAILKMLYKFK